MSNIIELFNPKDEKFQLLSNNSLFPMKINGELWNSVTQYIYTNMTTSLLYKDRIKNSKRKEIYNKYIESRNRIENEIQQESIEKALEEKYKNRKILEILLSTNDAYLLYVSSNNIIGSGRDGKGMNLLGKYSMQIRDRILNKQKIDKELEEKENNIYDSYVALQCLKRDIIENGNDLKEYLNVRTVDDIIIKYGEKKYKKNTEDKKEILLTNEILTGDKNKINKILSKLSSNESLSKQEEQFYVQSEQYLIKAWRQTENTNQKILLKKIIKKIRSNQYLNENEYKIFENIYESETKIILEDIPKEDSFIKNKMLNTFAGKNIVIELYKNKDPELYPLLSLSINHPEILVYTVRKNSMMSLARSQEFILKNKIFDLYINNMIKIKYPDIQPKEYAKIKDIEFSKLRKVCMCGKSYAEYNKPGEEPLYCDQCKIKYETFKTDIIKTHQGQMVKDPDIIGEPMITNNIITGYTDQKFVSEDIIKEVKIKEEHDMVKIFVDNELDNLKNKVYKNWKKLPSELVSDINKLILEINIPSEEDIVLAEKYIIPEYVIESSNIPSEKINKKQEIIQIYPGNPPENFKIDGGYTIQFLSPIYFTGMLHIDKYEYPTVYHYIIANLFKNIPTIGSLEKANKYLKKNDNINYDFNVMN